MRRLRVTILDLVSKRRTTALYARLMHPNLAGLMPQAVAVWCEELGHQVRFVCYTGLEEFGDELVADTDVLIISSFTQAAHLAYALSSLFRRRGAITLLGGPHARAYPQDARRYFDYVLGLTDKTTIADVLNECERHRPEGRLVAAREQPRTLPSVRERWKFIEPTIAKAPTIKVVPMIASLGCPYTCSFCVDATVDYKAMDHTQIRDDLRFLVQRMKRPIVGWQDPNFGVRFDDVMSAIEEASPPGSIEFLAESSLSLLSESRLERMRRAGFKAVLPGIESWYSEGNKSRTGARTGLDKVQHVSDHVNLVMRYIPYVQTNFVLGLDADQGPEPFELTKRFLDLTPGAFPGYSLLSAFGQAAPLNLEFQRAGRVLPFPFHFLNNNHAMNVRPKNYGWREFYDRVIDLTRYSHSARRIVRRLQANRLGVPGLMNVVRAISSEGRGRIAYYRQVRALLDSDVTVNRYFEAESDVLPTFYESRVRDDLGDLWKMLPVGGLRHDPYAFLKSQRAVGGVPITA